MTITTVSVTVGTIAKSAQGVNASWITCRGFRFLQVRACKKTESSDDKIG
jgi:hypothetical protein